MSRKGLQEGTQLTAGEDSVQSPLEASGRLVFPLFPTGDRAGIDSEPGSQLVLRKAVELPEGEDPLAKGPAVHGIRNTPKEPDDSRYEAKGGA